MSVQPIAAHAAQQQQRAAEIRKRGRAAGTAERWQHNIAQHDVLPVGRAPAAEQRAETTKYLGKQVDKYNHHLCCCCLWVNFKMLGGVMLTLLQLGECASRLCKEYKEDVGAISLSVVEYDCMLNLSLPLCKLHQE